MKKMAKAFFIVGVMMNAWSVSASAAEPSAPVSNSAPAAAANSTTTANESDLVIETSKHTAPIETPWARMTLGACVLVGILGASYFGLQRMSQKSKKGENQFELKTLARHHLGPKKYLAVIKVAGETMLIGVTDHHIGLVKSLSILDTEINNQDFDELMESPGKDDFSISKVKDVFKRGKQRDV